MLSREIIVTEDGSTTIFIPEWNEFYHSKHGAIQEAYHVFIRNGLDFFSKKNEISLLEIGLGTGLNALITYCETLNSHQKINYTGIEKFPILMNEISHLNYTKALLDFNTDLKVSSESLEQNYQKLMEADWSAFVSISSQFYLKKVQADFLEFDYPKNEFDLIYFDAFGARVQPELWTEELFEKLYKSLKNQGILTTYSAKGSVRRALISVGFQVEKKPGPPGKREMLVAIKNE